MPVVSCPEVIYSVGNIPMITLCTKLPLSKPYRDDGPKDQYTYQMAAKNVIQTFPRVTKTIILRLNLFVTHNSKPFARGGIYLVWVPNFVVIQPSRVSSCPRKVKISE